MLVGIFGILTISLQPPDTPYDVATIKVAQLRARLSQVDLHSAVTMAAVSHEEGPIALKTLNRL